MKPLLAATALLSVTVAHVPAANATFLAADPWPAANVGGVTGGQGIVINGQPLGGFDFGQQAAPAFDPWPAAQPADPWPANVPMTTTTFFDPWPAATQQPITAFPVQQFTPVVVATPAPAPVFQAPAPAPAPVVQAPAQNITIGAPGGQGGQGGSGACGGGNGGNGGNVTITGGTGLFGNAGTVTIGGSGGNGGSGTLCNTQAPEPPKAPVTNPIVGGGPWVTANPGTPGAPGTVTVGGGGTPNTPAPGGGNPGGGQVPAPAPLTLIAGLALMGAWRRRRATVAAR